ncbi:response regulator [Thalassotalea agarivorans]|uniref:Putative two-component system response regulator n=1 Tax=Thalassotalea agarivorans TaxID=349064 RepID=A0A1I0FVD0_THASX|nr:response regulator [Thalassotalea agarivorans]SET61623.1 putative two-component system response regulator [Thalassotalea agarivorans]
MPEQAKVLLIVDDEPSNIDIVKQLMPAQYKLKAAKSGMLAEKICAKAMPDVILMDVQMPEQSGIETVAHIRALPDGDKTTIIYATGSPLPEGTPPEQGVLLKPIEKEQFLALIEA